MLSSNFKGFYTSAKSHLELATQLLPGAGRIGVLVNVGNAETIDQSLGCPGGTRARAGGFNAVCLLTQQRHCAGVIGPIHMAACSAASRDYVFDGPEL